MHALQRGILVRRENPTYLYWAAATRGFTMVLFTASRRNKFVGGTCARLTHVRRETARRVIYRAILTKSKPIDNHWWLIVNASCVSV